MRIGPKEAVLVAGGQLLEQGGSGCLNRREGWSRTCLAAEFSNIDRKIGVVQNRGAGLQGGGGERRDFSRWMG